MPKNFKHIYGPVSSWRLGSSLGIDLLGGGKKHCLFDCVYCQLGTGKPARPERKVFVPTKDILAEIKALPPVHIDYLTFSGSGEPTLAKNLGAVIRAVKKIRPEPVAVLTGSSLIYTKGVQRDLRLADLVAIKLDADSEDSLKQINRPWPAITFAKILRGISAFRKSYRGKLVLQVMCMRENKELARNIAVLARVLRPDEIHLTTPTRPCAVKALSRRDLEKIKNFYPAAKTRTPYELTRKKVRPLDRESTLARRGKL